MTPEEKAVIDAADVMTAHYEELDAFGNRRLTPREGSYAGRLEEAVIAWRKSIRSE